MLYWTLSSQTAVCRGGGGGCGRRRSRQRGKEWGNRNIKGRAEKGKEGIERMEREKGSNLKVREGRNSAALKIA